MPINTQKLSDDIERIGAFSEFPPTVSHSRPTFSRPWKLACDYVVAEAESVGCKTRIDAAGNIHCRQKDLDWATPVWLSGSHLDSVPTGGKFDGVAGVVAPLAVLRAANGRPIPLEMVVFAEEEGTTFGLGMIGSRLWTGDITADRLQSLTNKHGQNYLQAGAEFGVDPARFAAEIFNPGDYLGLIEIHAEQGPGMWETETPVAVVTAIAGRMQFTVELVGTANHAGSTPMKYRRDALVSAAKMIVAIEQLAKKLGRGTVATVGKIVCRPNAINVIPGGVGFTIDLRSPWPVLLREGFEEIQKIVPKYACGAFDLTTTEDQPVVAMDEKMCRGLSAAGGRLPTTTSGALHDAAILAPHLPTAMIFFASRDGISHNPAEYSRTEDVAAAAGVLEKFVTAV